MYTLQAIQREIEMFSHKSITMLIKCSQYVSDILLNMFYGNDHLAFFRGEIMFCFYFVDAQINRKMN